MTKPSRDSNAWPKTVTVGSASVKVYRVKHPTNRTGKAYVLAWSTPKGRQVQKFADSTAALNEARLKAGQLHAGRVEGAQMTTGDRDELQAARALSKDTPLLAALEEWKRCRELAGGSMIAACEKWASANGGAIAEVLVDVAVKKFLAAKIAAGVDVTCSYNKILPSFLTKFSGRNIGPISAAELDQWMVERYPNLVSRQTARKRIVALWRWCRDKQILPRDQKTEAEFSSKQADSNELDVGIIDVATYARLLEFFHKNHPEYLGSAILAGFCGLRRSEVHGQKWEDVDLVEAHIRVSSVKKNTPSKRLVPLSAAAIEWLKLCQNREGAMCTNLAIDRIRHIALAAKDDAGEALFPNLPDNCFRHAFISHRVAATRNVAETSLEAGNSPKIIHKHYLKLVTKAQGEAWFMIPTPPANHPA